jgi:hypothetical protein
MPREPEPLKRISKKDNITINIADIFRNPDIQKEVIKNVKKLK